MPHARNPLAALCYLGYFGWRMDRQHDVDTLRASTPTLLDQDARDLARARAGSDRTRRRPGRPVPRARRSRRVRRRVRGARWGCAHALLHQRARVMSHSRQLPAACQCMASKQEALEQPHAERTKHPHLFRSFHAFCDHLDPKLVAYRNDPLHDGQPHGAEMDVPNEAPIELDDVRLKRGQQFQVCIASPEVIDGRGESGAFESSERRAQRRQIGDRFAFSEFEYQAINGKADPLGRANGGMKALRGPRNVIGSNVEAQPG